MQRTHSLLLINALTPLHWRYIYWRLIGWGFLDTWSWSHPLMLLLLLELHLISDWSEILELFLSTIGTIAIAIYAELPFSRNMPVLADLALKPGIFKRGELRDKTNWFLLEYDRFFYIYWLLGRFLIFQLKLMLSLSGQFKMVGCGEKLFFAELQCSLDKCI
jgi:hypothetical protein